MLNIKDFLVKFKTLTIPQETARNIISAAILKKTGKKIDIGAISIKNNIAYIKTTPLFKNEIFLLRKDILEETEITLGNKTPKNIL